MTSIELLVLLTALMLVKRMDLSLISAVVNAYVEQFTSQITSHVLLGLISIQTIWLAISLIISGNGALIVTYKCSSMREIDTF